MADLASTQRALPRTLPRLRRAGGVQAARSPRTPSAATARAPWCVSGEVLSRLGKMAELFDDHSPLQLMASGTYPAGWPGCALHAGRPPAIQIGRRGHLDRMAGAFLQRRQHRPRWARTTAPTSSREPVGAGPRDARQAEQLPRRHHHGHQRHAATASPSTGQSVAADGSAQGELPHLPPLGQSFDGGRAAQRRMARRCSASTTAPRSPASRPSVSVGRPVTAGRPAADRPEGRIGQGRKRPPVRLPALRRDRSQVAAQHQTKSITCKARAPASSSLEQRRRRRIAPRPSRTSPCEPHHPAGRHRPRSQGVALAGGGLSAPHGPGARRRRALRLGANTCSTTQKRGFAFLVDAEEGWSLVRPTTGAPQLAANGQQRHAIGAPPTSSKYALRGRNHLRGWASSTGRCERGQKTEQPRLRKSSKKPAVDGAKQKRDHLVRPATKLDSDTGGQGLQARRQERPAASATDAAPVRGQVGRCSMRHHHRSLRSSS
jgi:hypothetical protein